jgi:hypothetical protein
MTDISTLRPPCSRVLASSSTNLEAILLPDEAGKCTLTFRTADGEYSTDSTLNDGDSDFATIDSIRQCTPVVANAPWEFKCSPRYGEHTTLLIKTTSPGDVVEIYLES